MSMKENNKYYTPSIEEFYVGFEYEFNCPTGKKGESEWKKEIYDKQKWFHSNDSISYDWLIKEHNIRVKYLDSIDIQDLGFELIPDQNVYVQIYKGKDKLRLSHDLRNNNIQIYNYYKTTEYDETFFDGTIKNKSELKRLLKQIGIEYEKAEGTDNNNKEIN